MGNLCNSAPSQNRGADGANLVQVGKPMMNNASIGQEVIDN